MDSVRVGMSQEWSRVVSAEVKKEVMTLQGIQTHCSQLTSQNPKTVKSHLSLTLMRVKLVQLLNLGEEDTRILRRYKIKTSSSSMVNVFERLLSFFLFGKTPQSWWEPNVFLNFWSTLSWSNSNPNLNNNLKAHFSPLMTIWQVKHPECVSG